MAGSNDSPLYSKAESFLKIANISANPKPKSQRFKLGLSGLWGKLFYKNKEDENSRDTIALILWKVCASTVY
jgi:hypothetical protein